VKNGTFVVRSRIGDPERQRKLRGKKKPTNLQEVDFECLWVPD